MFAMALPPLSNLHNRGNTCYIASVVQALRSLHRFARKCDDKSPLGLAVTLPEIRDEMVPALYKWCRSCLKNNEGKGFRQADPSELLMELFDRKDVDTACFENTRVAYKECLTCSHVRRANSKEKMLIVTTLPSGNWPIQRAVDREFGYAVEDTTAEHSSVSPLSPLSPPPPPMSMSQYKSNYSGPNKRMRESASDARDREYEAPVRRESWWRCDDGAVQEVKLTTAVPYVLFYQERDGIVRMGEFETSEDVVNGAEHSRNSAVASPKVHCQELDCDEGKCSGAKRPHKSCVETYEIGEVLAIQIVFPKRLHMSRVERTLLTRTSETSDDPDNQTGLKAYDLVSFVSRVGGAHYVCYRKKV